MLDVPAGAGNPDPDLATDHELWGPLCAELAVAAGDAAELVCVGIARDHLGRWRRCAWHLVLHRHGGERPDGRNEGDWTHLYRVLTEHGRPLALLDQARPGDARAILRHHALRRAGRMP